MKAATCLIALGSNLGDRRAHLRFAAARIAELGGTRVLKSSRVCETPAQGSLPQPAFLNAVLRTSTRLGPAGLLVELKRIEALRGRRPGRRWGPRTLDCDILFYGRKRIETRMLRIPHPLALRRDFVLAPLGEADPRLRARSLAAREKVKWVGPL